MSSSADNIQATFHAKASELFFLYYNDFEKDSSVVNRREEEYHFQQLKKKYVTSLDHQLQLLAQSILNKNKEEKQLGNISQLFHQAIQDYLHRFVQKINAF